MSKNKKKHPVFTSQPYPLYAWGMWTNIVLDEEWRPGQEEPVARWDYQYNIDRLTIVGWMQEENRVIPMVSSIDCGIVPLYVFTGNPDRLHEDYIDEWYDQMLDEFILVGIEMVEPAHEVFEAVKLQYEIMHHSRHSALLETINNPTVVEEVADAV